MLDLGEPAKDRHGRAPRFAGEEIEINGTTFIIPAWNLKTARAGCEARKMLRDAGAGKIEQDSDEAIAASLHIAAITIQMNYPDVTEDALNEELTLEDLRRLASKILEMNTRRDPGEAIAAKTAASTTTTLTNGMISQP